MNAYFFERRHSTAFFFVGITEGMLIGAGHFLIGFCVAVVLTIFVTLGEVAFAGSKKW